MEAIKLITDMARIKIAERESIKKEKMEPYGRVVE